MNVTVYKASEAPTVFKPGTILLTHGNHSFVDSAIRFGQKLELTGADNKPYTWFNHAACVVNEDGTIMEMLAQGACVNNASKYQSRYYAILDPEVSTEDVANMVNIWQWIAENHTKYSWVTIASISLKLLTKSKIQFGDSDALICSGAATVGLCASSLTLPGNWRCSPGFVMPAELAAQYNVVPPA